MHRKKRDNPCKLHRKKAISNVQGGKNEQLNGYISEIYREKNQKIYESNI